MNGTFDEYSQEIWEAKVYVRCTIECNDELISMKSDTLSIESAYELEYPEYEEEALSMFMDLYPEFKEDNLSEDWELFTKVYVESVKRVN